VEYMKLLQESTVAPVHADVSPVDSVIEHCLHNDHEKRPDSSELLFKVQALNASVDHVSVRSYI
jgi:hypothetical protein